MINFILPQDHHEDHVKIYLNKNSNGEVDVIAEKYGKKLRIACFTKEGELYLFSKGIIRYCLSDFGFQVDERGRIKCEIVNPDTESKMKTTENL